MAEHHAVADSNAGLSMTPPASADGEKNSSSHTNPSYADFGANVDANANDNDNSGSAVEGIQPDHYYGGGKIPVFKPTMDQFRDFQAFIHSIDKYGMSSGVVKVVPPKEWSDSLPVLDEAIKSIRVKNPIMQEFHGTHGTYTQANIEKQRSYNLPQWKAVCDEISHQPPARRGERRWAQGKPARGGPRGQAGKPDSQKRKAAPKSKADDQEKPNEDIPDIHIKPESPPTPVSPESKPVDTKTEELSDGEPLPGPKPKGRQPKSVSARRKYNKDEHIDFVDEEAFHDFDYRLSSNEEFTGERCEELETAYWKSLLYNNPMYGADMPGSLFNDDVTSWNVAKLPNLLDVLGQKVPGVNTAYLYLGMWKATFAWHLEDVDLYSINYIHFGAPKQWYSISQEDLPRFEAAMRTLWPTDAKSCNQFLRHKTYLISPTLLKSQFGITVNKMVHYEGEFVITYPYGYHSGFNLGYNCAESVNFATEKWLDYARVAKKCHCENDTVWIDVDEIERRLRGEATPEFYDMRSDQDHFDGASDLLTPPRSVPEKATTRTRKRKGEGNEYKPKRVKLHLDAPKKAPCVLCPNDMDYEELLPTEDGLSHAHRRCALFIEETTILKNDSGMEIVCDIDKIPKARLGLKCLFCREVKGACFQCMYGKCARAYHPTCALLAGVQVEFGDIAVVADDGHEYTVPGIDLKCKYHRQKKPGSIPSDTWNIDSKIIDQARKLRAGDLVQFQADKEINGAVVLENRPSERSLLLKVLPREDVIELPYRWVLIVKKSNFIPLPPGITPLPSHLTRKPDIKKDLASSLPSHGTPFGDAGSIYQWEEFVCEPPPPNPDTSPVDIFKLDQLWHYLGKTSTECRAQYTSDLERPIHNPRSNFLESVKRSMNPPIPARAAAHPTAYHRAPSVQQPASLMGASHQVVPQQQVSSVRQPKGSDSQSNGNPSMWNPNDKLMKFAMARRLVASITEHANVTAGYAIVDPDFVVQALLGDNPLSIPKNGLDKLSKAMAESNVQSKTPDGVPSSLRPLNMRSDEVDHLLRMLRFALNNLTTAAKLEEPKAPKKAEPEPVKSAQSQELSLPPSERWAYLRIQRQHSAKVYRSPYAPGFGFSEYAKQEYGLVGTPLPSKKAPLASEFFAKLSPEDQEKVMKACGNVPASESSIAIEDTLDQVIESSAMSNSVMPPVTTSATANLDSQHHYSVFDMTLHAHSPASSFGRAHIQYQPVHDFGNHVEHEPSILPRQLHDHTDLFGDQQANQRFWQRSLPWADDIQQQDEDHLPFFGPHERPAGPEWPSSDMELGKGPGSLHSMDMAGFNFDGPDEMYPSP